MADPLSIVLKGNSADLKQGFSLHNQPACERMDTFQESNPSVRVDLHEIFNSFCFGNTDFARKVGTVAYDILKDRACKNQGALVGPNLAFGPNLDDDVAGQAYEDHGVISRPSLWLIISLSFSLSLSLWDQLPSISAIRTSFGFNAVLLSIFFASIFVIYVPLDNWRIANQSFMPSSI
eukprot:1394646-Amorphochlora_amoeboformis.AAC.2